MKIYNFWGIKKSVLVSIFIVFNLKVSQIVGDKIVYKLWKFQIDSKTNLDQHKIFLVHKNLGLNFQNAKEFLWNKKILPTSD